jgi:XTP/dITP diphosphohydrolase
MRVVLASNNQHKIQEIKQILAGSSIHFQSLLDFPDIPEPPENKNTFHENAEQKAAFVYEYTKGTVIADDSGLEVFALNGAPGIHSKRYTPEQTASANNKKLLQELQPHQDRKARFRCVVAVFNGTSTRYVEGVCKGSIGKIESGKQGFGYDPIFLPDGYQGKSLAELTMAEKNEISHRGVAFRQLPKVLATMDN